MAWTNLGKEEMFKEFFTSGTLENNFRLVLCTSDGQFDASTASTSNLTAVSSLPNSEGTEGGTSGIVVNRDGSSDGLNFDVSTASQIGADAARAVLQTGIESYQFSGAFYDARYLILVKGVVEGSAFNFTSGSNNVFAWWDIGVNTTIPEGSILSLGNVSLQGQ